MRFSSPFALSHTTPILLPTCTGIASLVGDKPGATFPTTASEVANAQPAAFRTVKPAGYPVPTDGPAGDLLRAQQRHPYRPAHLHFLGYKPGYKTLITQVFVDDDQHLESDVVFGVTRHLIGDFRLGSGPAPEPDVEGPWYLFDYVFVMEPGEAKLPVPPIR